MAKTLCNHLRYWSPKINQINYQLRIITHGIKKERQYCSDAKNDLGNDISSKGSEKEKRSDGIKKNILAASLSFVNSLGWSKAALTAGAESLGLPGTVHGLFPKGGADLVEYFYHISNENLVISLVALAKEHQSEISPRKPSSKVMAGGVEARLRMIVPYKERWPEALAIMTLPPNIPIALANVLTIVDDICYYAGDRSIDMSWYGRRLALAGIYKTTELYMLSDSSPDHIKTWDFLRRRVDEAAQFEGLLQNTESAGTFAKEFATATFGTARNILGLNWNR